MTKTQARRAAQLQRANKKNEEKKKTESGKANDIICSAVGSASVMAQTCTVCTCTCRKVASVNPEKQTL